MINCILKYYLKEPHQRIRAGAVENFKPSGFGLRQLGIADYKKIVSHVCCYDAGEVAHIENIMAREFKEKTTEKLYMKAQTDFQS